MNDKELIDLVSTVWVANGGDVVGFGYCYLELKEAIEDKLPNPQGEER